MSYSFPFRRPSLLLQNMQKFVVKNIYADHNKSKTVEHALNNLLQKHESGVMLNIGAGDTRIHPKIINLDLEPGFNVDIVGSADHIPLENLSVDFVVSQEVLEHVSDPYAVLEEIYRVLKPGGCFYLQLPWVIGYHGCPKDFWRFSKDGIAHLVESSGFSVKELNMAVGPFTGFYRIAVEAFAIFGSLFSALFYKPFKLFAAILFFPVKMLDLLPLKSQQVHRLAGGFFVVAIKK